LVVEHGQRVFHESRGESCERLRELMRLMGSKQVADLLRAVCLYGRVNGVLQHLDFSGQGHLTLLHGRTARGEPHRVQAWPDLQPLAGIAIAGFSIGRLKAALLRQQGSGSMISPVINDVNTWLLRLEQ